MNIENVLKQAVYSKKEVDFYVPIVTNYEENKTKNKYVNTSLFHYHLFNKKDSFIEILINKNNKKIVNLNLISINDVKKNIEIDKKIHEIPCILGNPIINTNIFKDEDIFEEKKDFDIVINNRKIYIFLDFKNIAKRIIMGDVEVLIDNQNNITGYVFINFSNEEWNEISEILESKKIYIK